MFAAQLLPQNLLQPGSVGLGEGGALKETRVADLCLTGSLAQGCSEGVRWGSDLGNSVGVKGTHRPEESGGLGSGGVGAVAESAQRSQGAAGLAVRGRRRLWRRQRVAGVRGETRRAGGASSA